MTFENMFESAKAALSKATVTDAGLTAAIQFNVTGDGSGIFYVKAVNGTLEIEPYDYIDNDAVLTADSVELITALEKADTASLSLTGNEEKIAAFRAILATLPAPKKTTTRKTAAKTTATATKKTTTTAKKTTATKAAATKTTAAKKTTTKTTAAKAGTETKATAKTVAAKTTKATKK